MDAAFVYTTGPTTRAGEVREAFRHVEDTCRPVISPAAVIAASKQPALARGFTDLLTSEPCQAVLATFGFQPPPGAAR